MEKLMEHGGDLGSVPTTRMSLSTLQDSTLKCRQEQALPQTWGNRGRVQRAVLQEMKSSCTHLFCLWGLLARALTQLGTPGPTVPMEAAPAAPPESTWDCWRALEPDLAGFVPGGRRVSRHLFTCLPMTTQMAKGPRNLPSVYCVYGEVTDPGAELGSEQRSPEPG